MAKQDIPVQQNALTNYLNNEIKKSYSLLYDIEEKLNKDKPQKVSYAKPQKEKEIKKDEKKVEKKGEKKDDKKSKNKKPEVKDKKTEITERLQELKKLKEAKEQKEASSGVKSLDELIIEKANVGDFYNEREELSDSEKDFYKNVIQNLNNFLEQEDDEAVTNLIAYYQTLVKQLNAETESFENVLKEKQKVMRENEELLKKYKTDYLEKKERIYEAKEAVTSSAAVSLPQLKEQYDTLNRNIPLIRNEFNKAKEADIAHRKKIDKYLKDIETITIVFINKQTSESLSSTNQDKMKELLDESANDIPPKLETFEEEDWD